MYKRNKLTGPHGIRLHGLFTLDAALRTIALGMQPLCILPGIPPLTQNILDRFHSTADLAEPPRLAGTK